MLNPIKKTMILYCFRNRNRETSAIMEIHDEKCILNGWLLEICVFSDDQENHKFSLERYERYYNRIKKILGIIGLNSEKKKVVGIENYSFSSQSTQADTILKEMGGIIRMFLCMNGHQILEIPPSQIKKTFTNKGSADKNDMYENYLTVKGMPNLLKLMNLENKKYKKVPHPVEDMVDAFATALCVMSIST